MRPIIISLDGSAAQWLLAPPRPLGGRNRRKRTATGCSYLSEPALPSSPSSSLTGGRDRKLKRARTHLSLIGAAAVAAAAIAAAEPNFARAIYLFASEKSRSL